MKLQDTFGDLSASVKKKWRSIFNKEENAVEETEDSEAKNLKAGTAEAKHSMTEGNHGEIFGLSRPVVTGLIIFFIVIIASATFYAVSSDDTSSQNQQQQASEADIADSKRAGSTQKGTADDYGELARINAAKKGQGPNGQNPQNPNAPNNPNDPNAPMQNGNPYGQATVQSTPTVAAQPAQVPVVPRPSVVVPAAGAYPQASIPQGRSEGAQQSSEDKSVAQRMKEKLSSAIAFAFDGKKGASEEAASDGETNKNTSGSATSSARNGAGLMQTNYTGGSSAPVYREPTERTVMAGTIIPAMLITGINTDAPGPVIAQVMADVYDMYGRTLLIPAGSRVLGKMGGSEGSSKSMTGRIGVTFDTVVLPNGGAWSIGESIMAVDGAGYAGIHGKLNRHTGSNLMKGLFNSALTALSTAAVDRVTFDATALTSLTESQAPTATVAPGYSFNLYVTENIAF